MHSNFKNLLVVKSRNAKKYNLMENIVLFFTESSEQASGNCRPPGHGHGCTAGRLRGRRSGNSYSVIVQQGKRHCHMSTVV